MNKLTETGTKIRRKWTKIRLLPIRVFCLHHVCATFDAESMNKGDWMQIDEFKRKVLALQQDGVEFVSLMEAYNKINNEKFRSHKYAVLTFDDGYASLKEIMPWLEEQHIPAIIFINGKYLDGKSYRNTPKEKYLTYDELFAKISPLIEIGSHGWEHADASAMTEREFAESIRQNMEILSAHPHYVSFHAYTWGRHTDSSDKVLIQQKIIPVLIDGEMNYSDNKIIHRELLK